ncbi:M48 family metallopeptidase [Prevotella sp. 10(H)]|uniref:M48 family metallopeptidase n=1 Tax=Prevotella sp. 10(H) TaxID=1158294 RepID=UPI00350F56F2
MSTLLLLSACSSVPLTGRKQLSLVSNQEVMTLSLQQYDEFMKDAKLSTDAANTALVVKVGRNIANAVETYLKNNGKGDLIASYSWEFHLVKSPEVNAFCMPGGKIVVYEGILPYTRDETGLAVVLGHEVSHAVARHANERMSQQLASQLGGVALGVAMSNQKQETQEMAMAVYGLGSQVGILLPYSRKQESEADHLGLIFMAMAGYDPREAPVFWERMAQQGGKTPELLSTHPSDQTRERDLQKELPEALKYYKGHGQVNTNSPKTSTKWSF